MSKPKLSRDPEDVMRQNLFAIAQTYASHRGITLSTLSNKIHGNHRFLERYLEGQISTTIRTYFQMINQLRVLWPDGLAWPKTVALRKLGKKVDDGFDRG
jgi:hypothetical protein